MKEKLRASLPFLGLGVCPVLTFILTEFLIHNPFTTMKPVPTTWILNVIFYWGMALLLTAVMGRIRPALMLQTVFFLIAGLANYYVYKFRSAPILPWDIYSFKTAASVADNFTYALPEKVWLVLFGFLLLLTVEFFMKKKITNVRLRLTGALLMLVLLGCFAGYLQKDRTVQKLRLYDKMFTPDTVQFRNGMAAAFLMELKYLFVEKPEGYSAEEAGQELAAYEEETGQSAEEKPNIIVIMNEAFSDMAVNGELKCNRDYMPFVHSLETGAENTITGKLNVSVLGGNTANTEFEFLTGNTMAFFPQGSIPYQQYLNKTIPSLPNSLLKEGYQTMAMHPYFAKGWSRNKVYPLLGFEQMRFIDDFPNAEYIRKYVSDKSDMEKIIEEYEKKEAGKPLFLFNVTMQNHGGYSQDFADFIPEIKAEGIESSPLEQYLSLIEKSDKALEELISYFKEKEEPTIVVFFGDHQPNDSVAGPIWKANGISKSNLSEEQTATRYQVPFVIWANFDIEEAKDVETSVNYLGTKVLQLAGLPLDSYQKYLCKLQEEFPVISAETILDRDGNRIPEDSKEEYQELKEYQKLQYFNMYDRIKSEKDE